MLLENQVEVLERSPFDLYMVASPGEIASYLDEHPKLKPLLTDLYYKIQEYFGAGATVRLEVAAFPESNYRRLYARVMSSEPAQQALIKLRQLQEDWWLSTQHRDGDVMTIGLEFP